MPSDPRTFAVDRVLRDGGSIHVRAIRPDDKQRLLDHFHNLSPCASTTSGPAPAIAAK